MSNQNSTSNQSGSGPQITSEPAARLVKTARQGGPSRSSGKREAVPSTERKAIRFPEQTAQLVTYWAAKRGVSFNEYVLQAVAHQIAWENQDYPLPTLEQARLNQLVAGFNQLAVNQGNLERLITSGFDSLLGLTRGDAYLLDEEEGEL